VSLITKPPSWGHCTSNFTGTPAGNSNSLGTSNTSGASNVDGSSVALLTNIAHDVAELVIQLLAHNAAATNTSALADILVDPAGGSTWASAALIDDLLVGESPTGGSNTNPGYVYCFPIWLKSGHSIGVRTRTAAAAGIAQRVFIHAYGGNANPGSWWCGQTIVSVGINAATSVGTNHTAGNSGAFSAWASLGSALSKPCGAVQWAVQGTNTDTTQNAAGYFFQFGAGSTQIGPTLFKSTSTGESGALVPTGPIFAAIPSGTQLQVRGTCSGTAEALDVAAYAVM